MQKVRAGKVYGLKAVLNYIQNPDKTKKGLLISAKDCLLDCAYKQMILVKHDNLQDSGRQYVHIIQSFSIEDKLTGETANEIGKKLMQKFDGFQGVVATHIDKNHIHNHIVLNSVNWQTGLKWQQSKNDLQKLKDLSDELCKEYGLIIIEKGKGWEKYGECKASVEGISWKEKLAENIAECVKKSASRQEFIHNLYRFKIEVVFNSDSLLFILPDGKKCGSDKLLSYGDFTKENLAKYIKYNDTALNIGILEPNILYEAIGVASRFLNYDDRQYLQNKYFDKVPFTSLEGQALREAIIKLKNSSHMEWIPQANNQEMNKSPKQPYLLMSVNELLELVINEKQGNELARQKENIYSNGYDEEDEYEM